MVKAFQSLVGILIWIARCTRPEICFAVHNVIRKMHQPTVKDWKMVKDWKVLKRDKGFEVADRNRKWYNEGHSTCKME